MGLRLTAALILTLTMGAAARRFQPPKVIPSPLVAPLTLQTLCGRACLPLATASCESELSLVRDCSFLLHVNLGLTLCDALFCDSCASGALF